MNFGFPPVGPPKPVAVGDTWIAPCHHPGTIEAGRTPSFPADIDIVYTLREVRTIAGTAVAVIDAKWEHPFEPYYDPRRGQTKVLGSYRGSMSIYFSIDKGYFLSLEHKEEFSIAGNRIRGNETKHIYKLISPPLTTVGKPAAEPSKQAPLLQPMPRFRQS